MTDQKENSSALPGFSKVLVVFLLHRYTILSLNLALFAIVISSSVKVTQMLQNPADDFLAMENVLDGIAAALVAYGVILEERGSLMKIFGHYPLRETPAETMLDHWSHRYGVLFLIIGLLVEVATGLVKIPNYIINTADLEPALFTAGILLLILAGLYLLRFSYLLIKRPLPLPADSPLH